MAGTDGPERYHQLLRSTGLDARQVLSGALAPFEAPRPALRSLAQYLAQPEQLHQQLREEQPDATTPRLQRAYLSVLQQDLALQVIAPLTLRLFRTARRRCRSRTGSSWRPHGRKPAPHRCKPAGFWLRISPR